MMQIKVFTRFVTHFSKLQFQAIFYLDLDFLSKESNVSLFDDTVNFTIFQKAIASRIYTFRGWESCALKEPFFLYVILKPFFGPRKASALDENVSNARLRFFCSYNLFS